MTTTWARRIRTAAAAALLLAAAVACDNGTTDGGDRPLTTAAPGPGRGGGPTALGGRAFLSTAVSEAGEPRELVAGTRIRLSFEPGRVSASAGCNILSGDLAVEGDRLVVDTVGGTEMGCPGDRHAQDDWLVGFLTADPTWRLEGDALVLRSGPTTIELVDEELAVPDAELLGTTWVLDTLSDGATASSVPAGVESVLRFTTDVGVVGNGGCNGFGGPYAVEGSTITFGDLASTLIGCEDARAEVEAQVLAVLRGEVTWAIDGDRLTLTAVDGTGLGYRAEPA